MDEILEITVSVANVFERLRVPYLIGGSLASSLHGIPRGEHWIAYWSNVAGGRSVMTVSPK